MGSWAESEGCGQGEAEAPREGRAVRASMEASSTGGAEHLRRSFIHVEAPARGQTDKKPSISNHNNSKPTTVSLLCETTVSQASTEHI